MPAPPTSSYVPTDNDSDNLKVGMSKSWTRFLDSFAPVQTPAWLPVVRPLQADYLGMVCEKPGWMDARIK